MMLSALLALGILYRLLLWYPLIHRDMEFDVSKIKARMIAYAELKPPPEDGATVLHTQHEILLGMLKKVEGKNAALATMITFITGAVFAFSMSDDVDPAARASIAFVIPPLCGLLVATVTGMRHLSNSRLGEIEEHLMKSGATQWRGMRMAEVLQLDLMLDLQFKERAFRLALFGFVVASALAAVLLPLYILGAELTA